MGGLEWIGYAGSVLVAVSLSMSNIWYLRWINFVGAAVFALYGYLIGATPVLVLNAWIALIDLWYIWKMVNQKEVFHLHVMKEDEPFSAAFLRYHQKDIATFFPDFDPRHVSGRLFLISRDLQPVGLFGYQQPQENGDARIAVDYVIPAYRDLKNARFVFQEAGAKALKEDGITRLSTDATHPKHRHYLKKMGFQEKGETWELILP